MAIGTDNLWDRFVDPPAVFGPTPIWWWSGDTLEPERLRWQLERFVEGGIGAVVVLNLAPAGPRAGCEADDPPFFSEQWWKIFQDVCATAADLGLKLYFYDQIGFSGANIQGRIVTRRPDFAGEALHRVTRTVTESAELTCPPEGSPLMACAMPVDVGGEPVGPPTRLPLDGATARWPGSETPHRLTLAYRVVRGFDYFSPEACHELIGAVHGAYETHAGDFFGSVVAGSFQDELPSMPTWSTRFAGEFAARNGYDLIPQLAALWEDYGTETRKVRRDYHATRAALCEEAFFEPLHRWHAERGLICGFDQQGPVRAGFPVQSVQCYADYPRTHRWFGAPGSDHHGDAKIHSSLAHAYDQPRVWLEAFHSTGWGGTLDETFDWLLPWLRAGANLYNPHAVYYSTRGGWWEWAPPATDWRQPYWRHHDRFARTVARLCSVLTLGRHVCDVAVLHPTVTAQAGSTLDGPTADAERAHATYLELVGQMRWYDPQPGVLDRACRDFDVLDDASLDSAVVRDGRLHVAQEVYRVVILPACSELTDACGRRLAEFATNGGVVLAIGVVPAALASLVTADEVEVVPTAEAVPSLLAEYPGPVEAPVPTLLRRIGDTPVLFVPAISSRATRVTETGSGSVPWTDVSYTFDPESYARTMRVRVHGVTGVPVLWEPYSGRTRSLPARQDGSVAQVDVPFDDAPCALVTWQPDSNAAGHHTVDGLVPQGAEVLGDMWRVRLEPTLDNRWGDFSYPAGEDPSPVQCWSFRWRPEDDAGQNFSQADLDDAGWEVVHATFGPHGEWRPEGTGTWRPVRYSTSRGIDKDPIHDISLGPMGHVPEEFLDFGDRCAGRAVHFRTVVEVSASRICHLALGAPADKQAWLNGTQVLYGTELGYLTFQEVSLERGQNLLEVRLVPDRDVWLRGYYTFVTDPEINRRPEWMTAAGAGAMSSAVTFSTDFELDAETPLGGTVYLGSATPCRLYVNDAEIVRQGGFYPYLTSFEIKHIGVYDISAAIGPGRNVVRVKASDLGDSVGVLVDGVLSAGDASVVALRSGPQWSVSRDGVDCDPAVLYSQRYDPAWAHAWRRPHPLPDAKWLEGEGEGAKTVIPTRADAPAARSHGAEWLRFRLPPGAERMHVPAQGPLRVWVDGSELKVRNCKEASVEVDLPDAQRAGRICALRIESALGCRQGALLAGPVCFDVAEGTMSLGDWQDQGLAGYSGGIHYMRSFQHTEPASRVLLDLGRVRGTAEVWVNRAAADARIWSPYVFDITELVEYGENELQILVLNTLGPYMDAVSPTRFVFRGQTSSGLFGPVRLLRDDARCVL